MDAHIISENMLDQASPCIIVGLFENGEMTTSTKRLDEASQGRLAEVIAQGDITGQLGQTWLLHHIPNAPFERVLVTGLGPKNAFNAAAFVKAADAAFAALSKVSATDAVCALSALDVDGVDCAWRIRQIFIAKETHFYRFSQLKSQQSDAPNLQSLHLYLNSYDDFAKAEQALIQAQALTEGMALCKDLGNLPGNICTPTYLAEQAQQLGKQFSSIKVDVLEEKDMQKLGMGALLSVSNGSEQPAKLVIMHYQGAKDPQAAPIALVGKGITFDTGGISLKPPASMDEMKYDMGGAASVLGTLRAVAKMALPINLVCAIACSENLPGGRATKPGDIVTTMSGKTVEILNTDAEGRLVLCDTLTYIERFNPRAVLDIATLTGAMVIALGQDVTGVFANKDALADTILQAAKDAYDHAWQMPLWDNYQSQLDSNFADMANVGERYAASITAACFLSRFAENYPWAHLDIAGTVAKSGKAKGATGRPVPLLTQFLINEVAAAA